MELKRAGEMMIPLDEYVSIPYWFTLRQAMAEMEKAEVLRMAEATLHALCSFSMRNLSFWGQSGGGISCVGWSRSFSRAY